MWAHRFSDLDVLNGEIVQPVLSHYTIEHSWTQTGALSSRVVRDYVAYYMRSRTHLALGKDTPSTRPVSPVGRIVATPEVGGLHHRYDRIAA
jgi:hypothetical protein